MHRRLLLAGLAALAAAPALARAPRGLWFDPTQLPSYTGRLERWLLDPAGDVTRALLREGTQIIFPAGEAEALMAAVKQDETLTAYGVRARTAPVVIMLAWARSDSEPANFVANPSWFASGRTGAEELAVRGKVRAPLLSPQGEAMGVITEEGAVIRLPVGAQAKLDWLRPGAEVAAAGLGTRRDERVALDAARIGPNPDRLDPVPQP